MTHTDTFTACLDPITAESGAKNAPFAQSNPDGSERHPLFMPLACSLVLALWAVTFATVQTHDTAAPGELQAKITKIMNAESQANLDDGPVMEEALQDLKFAERDLARLILSN